VILQSPVANPKITPTTKKIITPSGQTPIVPIINKEIFSNFIQPYNENALQALDNPCNVSDLTKRLQHHRKIGDLTPQFNLLEKNYYFQRARGGGNCFYLSYASGVLHHLLQQKKSGKNPNAIKEAIQFLRNKTEYRTNSQNDLTEKVIPILNELEKTPTLENLYAILKSEKQIQPLVDYLRDFAVTGIRNKVDAEKTKVLKRQVLEWDNDGLFPIIQDSTDLQKGMDEEKKKAWKPIDDKEAYCRFQQRDGADIQRPEIGIIHEGLWKLAVCLRIDDELVTSAQRKTSNGFLDSYPIQQSQVQVFRTGNHFDALLPKSMG
jgi:hypothetical protein